MLTRIFFLLMLSFFGFLQGCLSPISEPETKRYMLNAIPPNTVYRGSSYTTLLVATPLAGPGYHSAQMVYVSKSYEVNQFAKNRWVEEPNLMLQPLIVQTLQNTQHFHAVTAAPFFGRYNYRLDTELLRLQQDFTCRPSRVELKVRAQVVNDATKRIIATRVFHVIAIAPQDTPYGGVLAANCATSRFLRQLAWFVVGVT